MYDPGAQLGGDIYFFQVPPEIRKIIYTTNMIESYHRQLRKVTKGKSLFPTDEALLKILYMATQDGFPSQVDRPGTKLGPDPAAIIYILSR